MLLRIVLCSITVFIKAVKLIIPTICNMISAAELKISNYIKGCNPGRLTLELDNNKYPIGAAA